jgi:hypothetical protein
MAENEAKHVAEIEGLVVSYERRLVVGRVLMWTFIAVAVGEGVYILVDVLTP